MNDEMTEILAKCLERMEAGASLESCLAAFPKQAAELETLLRMTQQMKSLAEIGPRPTFSQNARLRLENQLAMPEKAVTFERLNRHIRQEPKLLIQRRFSMLQLIIAAALALAAGTGGVAYAANASSPGDYLHGVDLAMEQAQLNLTPDVSSKLELRIAFARERLDEAKAMFSENDAAYGLEAMNEYGTEISGIAQLIGSAEGADKVALTSLYETALSVHEDVLTKLLATAPQQAQEAIQKALDASRAPATIPAGPPTDAGRPAETPAGPPAGVPGGTPSGIPAGPPADVPGGMPGILGCPTQLAPTQLAPTSEAPAYVPVPSGTPYIIR